LTVLEKQEAADLKQPVTTAWKLGWTTICAIKMWFAWHEQFVIGYRWQNTS